MLAILQADLDVFIRTYGKWGIVVFVGVVTLIGAAKLIKSGLIAAATMFKSLFEGTLADARAERDLAKQQSERREQAFMQALKDQAASFQQSSAERDKVMREGFDELLHEVKEIQTGSHRTGRQK